jgi:glutamate-1-semialdehyde 2,1-aminomutase
LCEGIRVAARTAGVPVSVGEATGMFTVFFAPGLVTNAAAARKADTRRYARFFNRLRSAGVMFPPSQFEAAFPGFAHTPSDIGKTLDAVKRGLRGL